MIGMEVNGIRASTHCFLLAFGWWRLLWCRHYDGGRGRVHSLAWVVWWPSCGNRGWNRGWNRWGVPEGIWGCTQETGGKGFSKTPIRHFAITQCLRDTAWLIEQHIDRDRAFTASAPFHQNASARCMLPLTLLHQCFTTEEGKWWCQNGYWSWPMCPRMEGKKVKL